VVGSSLEQRSHLIIVTIF